MVVTKKISTINIFSLILYAILASLPLLLVNSVSDLPISISNWESKVIDILNLNFPEDNFYPPGPAILILPFSWLIPKYFMIIFIYYLFSVILYFFICNEINDKRFRLLALMALPLNPALVWYCYSSSDTVFELFLLMLLVYCSIKNKIFLFNFSGLLLTQTRPAHWLTYLGISIYFLIKRKGLPKRLKRWRNYSAAFILLIATIITNFLVYGSFSVATVSGMNLYIANNKYAYLAHPKYDIEVFLTKGQHLELEPKFELSTNDPGRSRQYTRMAVDSIRDNPKEFTIATMQKIESYVFGIQKIPNLSGDYFLSADGKSIIIGEPRLKWALIGGHVFYEIYRGLLLIFLFISLGVYFVINKSTNYFENIRDNLAIFSIPWLLGFIPAILFFSDTRYKVVSEVILVPFILLVLQSVTINNHKKVQLNLV